MFENDVKNKTHEIQPNSKTIQFFVILVNYFFNFNYQTSSDKPIKKMYKIN